MKKTNVDIIPTTSQSAPINIPDSSKNLTLRNDQNTAIDYTETYDDMSQNYDDIHDSTKQEDQSIDGDNDVTEIDVLDTSGLIKASNQDNNKKVKRKLGFLQMRIDSTIYFDNMGYSYQIQNEKNDKK